MNRQQNLEIANTILSQIRSGTDGYNPGAVLMMCWGFNSPTVIVDVTHPGVQFSVRGRKHKGIVQVVLDLGQDMYNIRFLNNRGRKVKEIESVFCDQLTELIDTVVESGE